MIVRILGEGQWDVSDEQLDALNELDAAVEAAVDGGDRRPSPRASPRCSTPYAPRARRCPTSPWRTPT